MGRIKEQLPGAGGESGGDRWGHEEVKSCGSLG